jgi:two-component system, sensor histidine kinase and response regulator
VNKFPSYLFSKFSVESFLGNLPIGLQLFNRHGKSLYTNQAVHSIFDPINHDRVLTDFNALKSNWNGDQEAVLFFRNVYSNPVCAERTYTLPIATKEASDCHLHESTLIEKVFPVLSESNKLLYVFSIIENITIQTYKDQLLRENEEKYRSVVSAMAEGIVMQSISGEIIACNNAAESILGLTKDQMRGRTSIDPRWRSIHEDGSHFPGDAHPSMETLRTGKPLSNVIMGVNKPSGELTWISINSEPVHAPKSNEVIAVVTSFTDISEQKIKQQELHRLNQIKDKFFAVMAHDLRNPFRSLINFSELLQQAIAKDEKDRSIHYLKLIRSSAQNLYGLLNQILAWSAAEREYYQINRQKCNLPALIENMVELHKDWAYSKEIEIKLDFKYYSVLDTWVDPNRMAVIIRNLISNAIKYSIPGSVIEVALAAKGEYLIMSVTDHGIGMDYKEMNSLFDITKQKRRGTLHEYGGGLGLILCKEYTEAHGGSIRAESTEHHGSRFVVTIPIHTNETNLS